MSLIILMDSEYLIKSSNVNLLSLLAALSDKNGGWRMIDEIACQTNSLKGRLQHIIIYFQSENY